MQEMPKAQHYCTQLSYDQVKIGRLVNIVVFMEIFINKGLDVNVQDNDGETALHYAMRIDDQDDREAAVTCLLKKGINVNAKNNEGKRAQDLLSESMQDRCILKNDKSWIMVMKMKMKFQ